MKIGIDMFVKGQEGKNIQWPVKSSNTFKDKASKKEEEHSENSNDDEEDDEAIEDDMPY
ncbi:hypothetical protein J1N35_010661 [Gossypium stocksii]|uniref:Uncharacterized protein n=1 Tax=Gossypium stocksii TaxID=47602 RepID=A0A9D3W2S5_9ROSI|nr:hypothetical protein J1N35_010661 [Gossypium stocksii]